MPPPKPPSSTYTQGHNPHVIASHTQRTVGNSAAFLLPHLAPHFRLLDIGCGPGTITSGFCAYVPTGSVTGIDLAAEVVQQAVQTHPEEQYKNLNFEVGNILDGVHYDDSTFDVVFTHQTVLHIPEPVKAITEMRRVLKPGGILAMRESDGLHWYPRLPGLERFTKCLYGMVRWEGADGLGGREIHKWASEAGFERSKMVVSGGTTVFSTREEREWHSAVHVRRLRQGGIGETMVAKRLTDQEEVDEICRDLEKWREDEDGWYCTLQAEVLAWK